MKAILLLIVSFFFLLNCTKEDLEPQTENKSTQRRAYNLDENIKDAYFKSWISGVRGGGSGLDFYIEFKTPLPREITLKYLYFRDKKAPINGESQVLYVSNFAGFGVNMGEDVVDVETERAMKKDSAPFAIGDDEALLEYFVDNQINYYLITNPKEVESEFIPQ